MPTAKKPAKAKKSARPQFGDWDAPRVTALLHRGGSDAGDGATVDEGGVAQHEDLRVAGDREIGCHHRSSRPVGLDRQHRHQR